jgi:hypothetical protein
MRAVGADSIASLRQSYPFDLLKSSLKRPTAAGTVIPSRALVTRCPPP